VELYVKNPQTDAENKILKTSIELFLANGFTGTTVRDITSNAGVGKGTLYWHFNSKDEILERILEKYSNEFVEEAIKRVRLTNGRFGEKFNALYRFVTEFARDNRELLLVFITVLAEAAGSMSAAEQKMQAIRKRLHLLFKDLLSTGRSEGLVDRAIDPDIQSHVLDAFFIGMLLEWYLEGEGPRDVVAYSRAFRQSILQGLANKDTGREVA
jgi:AcrR family transcriptional regulator